MWWSVFLGTEASSVVIVQCCALPISVHVLPRSSNRTLDCNSSARELQPIVADDYADLENSPNCGA